jgi:hypothetical protein
MSALDKLGLAITDAGYTWTPEMRKAYEEGVRREWEELDVNEVIEVIYENISNPSPELLQELYGLVAEVDQRLQEKNT